MERRGSFSQFLETKPTVEELSEVILSLDTKLKEYHSNGYYAVNIGFNSVYYDENGFSFAWIQKLPDDNSYLYKRGNIVSLGQFAMGAYNYLDPISSGAIFGVRNFDYSNYNSDFIQSNYSTIRSSIPSKLCDYYDGMVSGNCNYLSDFVSSRENVSGRNNNHVYSKSTNSGRLMSEPGDNSAFVQILLYPIIGICLSIISIISYLIYLNG